MFTTAYPTSIYPTKSDCKGDNAGAIPNCATCRAVHGESSVSPEYARELPPPEVIREKVTALIDNAINPAIAGHGGSVTLTDVQGNTIYLEFGGGCQGCGMAHVTLKYGVERLIREHIPEVGEILDATDHADGENPYYTG